MKAVYKKKVKIRHYSGKLWVCVKHLEQLSHVITRITMDNKKLLKKLLKFQCKKCDYTTSKKSSWKKHINTMKHKRITMDNKKLLKSCSLQDENGFACGCGKVYKYCSGLSKHKQKCVVKNIKNTLDEIDEIDETDETDEFKNLFKLFMKTQMDFNKELADKVTPSNVYNDCNNKKITINMFLNENCKDAMSLRDFLDKIQPTLNDLIRTKELGYVEGISNILIKNLNELPSIQRPIHCSDTKRLQFYVKDEGGWNKDTNQKVEKAIDSVTTKQIKILQKWELKNPNYMKNQELLNEWNLLVHNIMGGANDEEREKNKNDIKKKMGENIILKDAMIEF